MAQATVQHCQDRQDRQDRQDPAILQGAARHSGLSGRMQASGHRNGDLFAPAAVDLSVSAAVPERRLPGPDAQLMASNRPRFAIGAEQDHHFRMAMNVARRIGRIGRREQAGRLICHHLRCMLDEPAVPPAR